MVSDNEVKPPTQVNASPTKNFFVEMLTRDIDLEDSILDLLDNCVDGIQRIIKDRPSSDKPYQNFWAKITFSSEVFKIEDNCGGIPLEAQHYAFRMGRPTDIINGNTYTIGTYGIGMKRAIFKMGRSSKIISKTENDSFKVTINPEWLTSDSWELPIERIQHSLPENGTAIEVTHLRDGIVTQFSSPQSPLLNSLVGKISHHYSYIINKGFTVFVNGLKVPLISLNLLWDGVEKINSKNAAIAPYLYEARKDDVEIRLAVGFYRSIASEDEVNDETEGIRRSSDTAGWTIICNDRVVLYCDKTRLTGWGEATVPSYHPQFIAISGVIHFRSKDARSLPITTTKRGIDAASDIYLYVKDFMREGLKIFTSYTNKWKKNIPEEKEIVSKAKTDDPNVIFEAIPEEVWKPVKKRTSDSKSFSTERKFTPTLPVPEAKNTGNRRNNISFARPSKEIEIVAEYLFEDSEREPSEVGNECFERILREAKQ
ncbi:ATP-binding protein [Scytonema hofmannii FACHB-248]|uniref:ATP-binding protein n=1 Tax=Scytonema hofmannii FACHB-248 TaxID=1842502 RepID=A0ABR8GJ29_9CYAN|nr:MULTISPECIES: ATP-binding protein [Nostocales]MBD2603333.1 ATP-binding protein [Scytonema hofmannii FACHB-248]